MKNYTLNACEGFIDRFINEFNGEMLQIEEGSLGLGTLILYNGHNKQGNPIQSVLIKEYYISAWSSGHTVTQYKKVPKKYQALIDKQ